MVLTFYRYIFSPTIEEYINITDATLSLARCCIQYLCQRHHDVDLSEEELHNNILSGLYGLHEYSATMWLELIRRYLDLAELTAPPSDLISLFEIFIEKRSSEAFVLDTASPYVRCVVLHLLQSNHLNIYEVLCNTAYFQKKCSGGLYDKREGE